MLFSNPEHLNQIGCHIHMAVFLEICVFGKGALALPLRKGDFRIVHSPSVFYIPLDLTKVQFIC
jgi:hypothetical protein